MLWKFHSRLSKMHFLSRWCSTRACHSVIPRMFEVNPEVKECIQKGNPVVALESTIITHGMPYPQNLATAIKVEEVVRKNGAVPATVGVIEGKIHIGMDQHQLKDLASKQKEVVKISKRDLPFVLSKKLSGGTTVAATMVLANKAGIDIFVTGGVGGVHRDGENSMDVSADLIQLSETPMTVISAGVKSILDIGRTLEFLETQGVCVATYGKTKDFPSFFTPASGFQAPYNVETIEEAAYMILCRDELSLRSAILLAVPIPADQAADGVKTEKAIEQALKEARLRNIVGKEVTPFILSRVQEISGGASLKANIALIENNALVGSQIAVELSKLKAKRRQKDGLGEQGNNGASVKNFASRYVAPHEKGFSEQAFVSPALMQNSLSPRPVVIGGTVLDLTITSQHRTIQMDGGTHPGEVETSAGGVGRNLADCLSRLEMNPFFISALGSDNNAKIVLNYMQHVDAAGIKIVENARSAVCGVLLNQERDCLSVIGDMKIHDYISVEQVKAHENILLKAPLVAIDGNIPVETMQYVFQVCARNRIPVWFEPTDIHKAAIPFSCDEWEKTLVYISPNLNELRVMSSVLCSQKSHNKSVSLENNCPLEEIIDECVEISQPLVKHIPSIVITLGKHGSLVFSRHSRTEPFHFAASESSRNAKVHAVFYPAPKPSKVVSVSGAGDCFASAAMAATVRGRNQDDCVRVGQIAAMLSLSSHHAVPFAITEKSVFRAENVVFPKVRELTKPECGNY